MPAEIKVKSILNRKKGPDSWFLDEYTINPYSGCSFNCLFCYIRGSKYGMNMEDKLSVKVNAPELLEKQLKLRAKKNQYGFIVLSSATDPYLQFEKKYKMTREILEVILRYRFPVHIITRSNLVMRDFDLLKEINRHAVLPPFLEGKTNHKVFITFSFSTLDDDVARIFEPGATVPSIRLQTMKATIDGGFSSGVSMMPLLPWISDTKENLELMFNTFKEVNANYVMPASLTLFGNGSADSKILVFRAIEKHYPHLLEKYKNYFDNNYEMPSYYTKALYKKLDELGKKYELRNRIVSL